MAEVASRLARAPRARIVLVVLIAATSAASCRLTWGGRGTRNGVADATRVPAHVAAGARVVHDGDE